MEKPTIINLMRTMTVNKSVDLEELHNVLPNKTKLYLGRPEMLVMKMENGRNIQMFRKGTVQILGRVTEEEAESMREEFIMKLKTHTTMWPCQVTKLTVSNLVVSVQLKTALCLQKIALTDSDVFHETELFPAALIRKWHPVHIAVFHTGRIILTGLKSITQCYTVMDMLLPFLKCNHLIK